MRHKTKIKDAYLDYPYIGALANENSNLNIEEEKIIDGQS